MADLLVVGAGLLGTSIGLALARERDVVLADIDPAVLDRAARGAGRRWDGREPVELAVACVPPAATAAVLVALAGHARFATHVSSVQAPVQAGVEAWHPRPAAVCGGHPIAGSERSGPSAARADLFVGRPWAICPGPGTSPEAVAAVEELARGCAAEPVRMSPAEHDDALALVSHLPQAVSSALAAQLLQAPAAARLAGGGLRDTTRVAASDPTLWREVLTLNAAALVPLLRSTAGELDALADALAEATSPEVVTSPDRVTDLLRRGREGRALVPVKREDVGSAFAWVVVSVPDRPGQLSELLEVAARAGVNVEDVRVDHVPGRPRGLVQLAVRVEAEQAVVTALRQAGHEVLAD